MIDVTARGTGQSSSLSLCLFPSVQYYPSPLAHHKRVCTNRAGGVSRVVGTISISDDDGGKRTSSSGNGQRSESAAHRISNSSSDGSGNDAPRSELPSIKRTLHAGKITPPGRGEKRKLEVRAGSVGNQSAGLTRGREIGGKGGKVARDNGDQEGGDISGSDEEDQPLGHMLQLSPVSGRQHSSPSAAAAAHTHQNQHQSNLDSLNKSHRSLKAAYAQAEPSEERPRGGSDSASKATAEEGGAGVSASRAAAEPESGSGTELDSEAEEVRAAEEGAERERGWLERQRALEVLPGNREVRKLVALFSFDKCALPL